MRSSSRFSVLSVLSLCLLVGFFISATSVAYAQSPAVGLTVQVWNDLNNDGVYGSVGDLLIDSTTTDANGAYHLDVAGLCIGCGVVIVDWSPSDDEIDAISGVVVAWSPSDDEIDASHARLWNDLNENNPAGGAGDVLVDSTSIGADGTFALDASKCAACVVVIAGWSPSDDEIDSISGKVINWSPSDDNIDTREKSLEAWLPGADANDQWVPSGDDSDGWVPSGDDIDCWVPGGDDIDGWVPSGDDIDLARRQN